MKNDLATFYRGYIACLNAQDWPALEQFVDLAVIHNGRHLGLDGYRAMLEHDFTLIPDLSFAIALLVVEPPHVAARLQFDCSPKGTFMGLAMDGTRLRFCENVFYRVEHGRIVEVWSVIDKAAIEAQL